MRRLALVVVLLCAGCTATHGHIHVARQVPATPSPSAVVPRHLVVRTMPWRLPGPIAREAVLPTSGVHLLVAGGLLPGDTSSATSYTLDLATGHVRRGAPLPVPVHDTAAVSIRGRAVVVGGGNAAEQAAVQARSGSRWHVAGRLPSPRSDLAAVVVGGRAIVVGGYDGTTPALGEVLTSSDAVHWSRLGRLRVPVRYPGVAVLGRDIWVFGGERSGTEVRVVQRISPDGRVRVVGRLPTPLGHEAAAVLGHRILVAGGRTAADTLTARMWWFDPATRRFTAAGSLPHRLADSGVAQERGAVWLVGGERPTFSAQVLKIALTR